MKIIDISLPISADLPFWPNSSGLSIKRVRKIGKNSLVNETHVSMNAHVGTHIDAPLHFLAQGEAIDKVMLNIFIGPAFVVHLPKVKEIAARDLEKLSLPKNTQRILFKTSNSSLWKRKVKKFRADYVGLTSDAARWLAKRKFKLIGVDYLSVAKKDEAAEVHRVLLAKEICLLEGIDLSAVSSGKYEIICFPLKLVGREAAPARAVLVK